METTLIRAAECIAVVMGIVTAGGLSGAVMGHLMFRRDRRRNYRRPGTAPKDERGDWIRTAATMALIERRRVACQRGWATRRTRREADRMARMDADIKALMADGGSR
jgi:hypothetical protein